IIFVYEIKGALLFLGHTLTHNFPIFDDEKIMVFAHEASLISDALYVFVLMDAIGLIVNSIRTADLCVERLDRRSHLDRPICLICHSRRARKTARKQAKQK